MRPYQLGRRRLLVEVTRCTGTQQVDGVLVLRVSGQHQHGHFRADLLHGLQRIDAVLVGHGNVEQEDIELGRTDQRDGFGTGCRFAHDLHVGLVGDELAQTGAHDGVVVGNHDADHMSGPGW